jgi:flagellar secretion chaperone FliS
MKPNHIARQYRELAIKAATPVGLIIVLYDMAIESLAHATREIDAGNVEARTNNLNHALSVIGELERSLNFEAGGDVAKQLSSLYNVARCKILEANIKSSKQTIEDLSGVLFSVREAWQIVDQKYAGQPGMELSQEAPRMTPASPALTQQDEAKPQLQWSV